MPHSRRLLLFELGYCPNHELVEQRNCKCHVTVRGTVNHSLLYELGSHRSKAGHFHTEDGGDVSVRCAPGPSSAIPLRKFETNAEEILIEPRDYLGCRILHDGTLAFYAPEENTSLLENRVAAYQFRWRRASAWRERILDRIHV